VALRAKGALLCITLLTLTLFLDKTPKVMQEAEERREAAKNKGKKATAEEERLAQLVARIEREERNNIL
jgi:hypothetical protein